MQGCLPVDKKGSPLRRSIIWADQRSVKQALKLESELGEEKIYNITGHKISPTYSLEKIMWVKENEPDMYMPCGTMQTAGASYEWLKDNVCLLEQKAVESLNISPYELMDLSVEKSKPTANKLIFLPYLMGERSPHWNPNARGVFIGLNLKNNRNDIIRSIMEGVTYNLKIISEIFEDVIDFPEIRVIGGAGSPVWRKIMADIYNKKVLRPKIMEEATSLEAAIVGGVVAGIFDSIKVAEKLNPITEVYEPNTENVKEYESLYPVFKEAYESLIKVYDKLASL